jgi:hypothetical protein
MHFSSIAAPRSFLLALGCGANVGVNLRERGFKHLDYKKKLKREMQ